jgi:hypothetical protein
VPIGATVGPSRSANAGDSVSSARMDTVWRSHVKTLNTYRTVNQIV